MPSLDYERVVWKDVPSKDTPLNAENLNNMDNGLASLYSDVAAIEEELNNISLSDATDNTVTFETTQADLQPSGSTLSRIITGIYSKITSLLDAIPTLAAKDDLSDLFADVADVEETSTASKDYNPGDYIVYQNKFFKVDSEITANSDFTSSVTETTIGAEIQSAASSSAGEMTSYVGMVIHSTVLNTEASVIEHYGGTSWLQHTGYFLRGSAELVSANSAVSNGGSETVTLTVNQMPSHTHAQNPHSHTLTNKYSQNKLQSGTNSPRFMRDGSISVTDFTACGATTATNKNTGGGQPHNNMPPFKNVYIWERTA